MSCPLGGYYVTLRYATALAARLNGDVTAEHMSLKRDRDADDAVSGASSSDTTTVGALHALASAVNHGAERRTDAIEAEKRARAALVQQILATPPKQCFSPKALAAFKRKHVAMMARSASQRPTTTPPPSQQPTKTLAPSQPPPPGISSMMPSLGPSSLTPSAPPKPPQ